MAVLNIKELPEGLHYALKTKSLTERVTLRLFVIRALAQAADYPLSPEEGSEAPRGPKAKA